MQQEIRQFNNQTPLHELPPIYYYWSDRYIIPKLQLLGLNGAQDMFEKSFARQLERHPGTCRFASIGSGDGSMELEIAAALKKSSHSRFVIDCVELNPRLISAGNARAEAARLVG